MVVIIVVRVFVLKIQVCYCESRRLLDVSLSAYVNIAYFTTNITNICFSVILLN